MFPTKLRNNQNKLGVSWAKLSKNRTGTEPVNHARFQIFTEDPNSSDWSRKLTRTPRSSCQFHHFFLIQPSRNSQVLMLGHDLISGRINYSFKICYIRLKNYKPSFCSGSCDECPVTTKFQNKISLKCSLNFPRNTLDTFFKHP